MLQAKRLFSYVYNEAAITHTHHMISWIRHHAFAFVLLFVFCAGFVASLSISSADTFADPDSFYHMKVATNLIEGKDIRDFPWLPHTVLEQYYADQHFLYHVFLAPFMLLPDPFSGAKLATSLLFATFLTIFAASLRAFGIRVSWAYALLLLAVSPFLFRVHLVKAPVFSLIILFAGLAFAWRGRWKAVGVISAVYAWSYGGFVILPLAILLLSGLRIFSTWIKESAWLRHNKLSIVINWKKFFTLFLQKADVRNVFATLVGSGLAVVVNPFFPNNLQYLNDQLIQIGIVNFKDIIGVGGEWYPYDFVQLISRTGVITALTLIGLMLVLTHHKRLSLRSVYVFLLYVVFFAFTLKSRRYVEYFVPFALLFSASLVSDVLEHVSLDSIFKQFTSGALKRYVVVAVFFLIIAATSTGIFLGRSLEQTKADLRGGFGYYTDRDALTWLKNHVPKDAIVVHSDWDEFPYLMYWDDRHRYIAGLDPTFLYMGNKEKYWAWVDLTTGKMREGIERAMLDTLESGYIFIEKGHEVMQRNVERDGAFRKVYADAEASIYAHSLAPIF